MVRYPRTDTRSLSDPPRAHHADVDFERRRVHLRRVPTGEMPAEPGRRRPAHDWCRYRPTCSECSTRTSALGFPAQPRRSSPHPMADRHGTSTPSTLAGAGSARPRRSPEPASSRCTAPAHRDLAVARGRRPDQARHRVSRCRRRDPRAALRARHSDRHRAPVFAGGGVGRDIGGTATRNSAPNSPERMARRAGFEPPTLRFEAWCSSDQSCWSAREPKRECVAD